MSARDVGAIQQRRFRYALVVLGAIAAVFLLACLMTRQAEQREIEEMAEYQLVSEMAGPAWFEQEVFPVGMLEEGKVAMDWAVVGFTRLGSASSVLDELVEVLAQRGWVCYESGMEGIATLSKEKGVCSWLMISCSEVGDSVSVVLNIQRRT